ncbi:RnfH family protein [Gammaproteobacteria bacterium LSUCC0057]|uniref:UPF0125 protein E3W66_05455 n=1 Tax=Gammaproteobacteria bacterium LSUCC0057 TaxID=2559237 RepID=A0A4Y8UGZ1_9GAMM|nr:RnfH family protein [Gammaproteobacteria bacterium LSUCC0057]
MNQASAEGAEQIPVEVAFALPERQQLIALQVPVGTTALQAVQLSGICSQFEQLAVLPPEQLALGIFSQPLGAKGLPAAADYQLAAHDRVEIYRPLIADPKQVRKQRAERARSSS